VSRPVLGEEQIEALTARALAGDTIEELLAGLVAARVDVDAAWGEVAAVLRSPILAGARGVAARGSAVERAARLHLALQPAALEERTALDEGTLLREHWGPQRPVVLRGAASGWRAASWTFPELRDRFGWAPVDALVRTPGWWRRERLLRRLPFGELVDAVLGPPSDALYADGYASVLEQAGLAPLRAELGLLPGLVGDGHPRAWVGPAGTVTPTHTDQSSGWLTQLVGRKRVWLASPLEPALLDTALGLFAQVDPRVPASGALAEVRWHEVVLAPGDALFTPVGWWHQVEALEPSFSVSFSGFRWPNAFPWFVPG
jgi:hypothetical protein